MSWFERQPLGMSRSTHGFEPGTYTEIDITDLIDPAKIHP